MTACVYLSILQVRQVEQVLHNECVYLSYVCLDCYSSAVTASAADSAKIVHFRKEAWKLVWLFLWGHFKKKHVSHLKIQDGGHFQDGRHFRYGYIILCNEIIPTTVL